MATLLLGAFVITSTGFATPASTLSPEAHYQLALDAELQGAFAHAEDQFLAAVLLNPVMAEAYLGLSAVYIRFGRFAKAREALLTVIRTLPDSKLVGPQYRAALSMTYNNLGVVEEFIAEGALQARRLDAVRQHVQLAVGYYQRAVELDPRNAQARVNLHLRKGL
ncbi:MAG: tetratricopeptide repeat protein [Candidatus Marinimicrobia bacterium]|nr:tetratricopeptide repeat protein [Candidatus Neomarinimicrobiota bacterium]